MPLRLHKPGGSFFAFLRRKVFTQLFTGSGLGRNVRCAADADRL